MRQWVFSLEGWALLGTLFLAALAWYSLSQYEPDRDPELTFEPEPALRYEITVLVMDRDSLEERDRIRTRHLLRSVPGARIIERTWTDHDSPGVAVTTSNGIWRTDP